MGRCTGNCAFELGELLGLSYKPSGYNVTGNGERERGRKTEKTESLLSCGNAKIAQTSLNQHPRVLLSGLRFRD